MNKRLHIVPALAAVLALTGAPALATADPRDHDHGLFVKLGRDGGFWFGYQHPHAYVSHEREYRRVENELVEKRTRLLRRTQRALEGEDFGQTTQLLARLVRVDQQLDQHRDDHRGCHH